jgi:hypothetical protein
MASSALEGATQVGRFRALGGKIVRPPPLGWQLAHQLRGRSAAFPGDAREEASKTASTAGHSQP